MYYFDSRVRFSETDGNNRLTLEAIVDYFQDCSTFHTEDLGVGFAYLKPLGLTWVLSYWQIVIDEYPVLGENITIGTLPYDFRAFMGKRNFFMKKNEKMIARADSLWILLDLEKMSPVKIPPRLQESYPREEKIDMEYAPRKIHISGEESSEAAVTIQKHHLDCNGHVNNGQYIKIASAYLPPDFCVRQMRAEYKKQAHLGDVIYPHIYKGENKLIMALCDCNRQPYVVLEFI